MLLGMQASLALVAPGRASSASTKLTTRSRLSSLVLPSFQGAVFAAQPAALLFMLCTLTRFPRRLLVHRPTTYGPMPGYLLIVAPQNPGGASPLPFGITTVYGGTMTTSTGTFPVTAEFMPGTSMVTFDIGKLAVGSTGGCGELASELMRARVTSVCVYVCVCVRHPRSGGLLTLVGVYSFDEANGRLDVAWLSDDAGNAAAGVTGTGLGIYQVNADFSVDVALGALPIVPR